MSVSFCAYWSDAVIFFAVLICNWTLHTRRLLPPSRGAPSLTWPVSIMKAWFQCDSLISLFTALQVNADSKLQQAAVKHVINTALAANETQLLGLFWELQFCDELCQSQLTCCVQNETQIIFFLPQTLVIFSLSPPPQRITILLPERLITCTNKRVGDINTKFHRLFFISDLQLPLHFPPGNYIRIVYTRNCHLIIMKLVLSWQKWA